MPLVLADRVRDTTTTTGTGTVTLSGTAPTGYQNFSVIGNGNTTYYTINAGSQWEVGIGTYSSTGPTLSRDTVLSSSAGGTTKVDFAAGTKDVFVTYPSGEAVYQDGASIAAGTAVLPVANGGTGVTTSTGTGSVVLSNSPTLVTPVLGAASATSIANALGAVGTPSYTFTGDLNTGIYSPAADTLAFVEGGVEAMRITSTARVGIGTSAPTRLFSVAGTTSAYMDFNASSFRRFTIGSESRGFILFDDTASAFRMIVDADGNVGIGPTSPSTKLDVAGAISASLGTVSAPSYTFTGDLNTGIYSPAADTLAFVEGGVEVMRITSAGLVQINTTSGAGWLNVNSSSGAAALLLTNSANSNPFLQFANGSFIQGIGASSSEDMRFRAGGTTGTLLFDTNSSERMRITAAGDVGIGTNSPGAKLDILGTTSDQLRLRTAATEEYRIGRNASTGLLDFYGSQTGFTGYVFGGIDGERMRITSAGNVGIACTPLSATRFQTSIGTDRRFSVFLNGSDNVFGFLTDAGNWTDTFLNGSPLRLGANGTERMRILSTGEVGVNTTAPGTTFEVALSTTGLPGLRASRSGAQTQYIQMDIGGGASARLFATGGNKAMFITNNNSGAGLGTATDSTFIQVPGPTANTPITAMYLESSTANVGIGTTAPAGRVHATNTYTNTSNTNFIADGNIPGLNLRPANGRFSLLASYGAANTSSIVLGTGTANPSTEAMRFDHSTGGINVGAATPNAAAQLQVDSTTRGFLPPRMTTAQRDAIASPPDGLMLYNSSTNKLQVRAAGAWVDLH